MYRAVTADSNNRVLETRSFLINKCRIIESTVHLTDGMVANKWIYEIYTNLTCREDQTHRKCWPVVTYTQAVYRGVLWWLSEWLWCNGVCNELAPSWPGTTQGCEWIHRSQDRFGGGSQESHPCMDIPSLTIWTGTDKKTANKVNTLVVKTRRLGPTLQEVRVWRSRQAWSVPQCLCII